MLRTSLTKSPRWLLPMLAIALSGCGLTQSVSDGTRSALSAVFHKKIKVLHLDFSAREALNTDARENTALSQSMVVRVYQLKDIKTFERSVYSQLLNEEETTLGDDLLATRDVVVKPGSDVSLNMPMEDDTNYVAVVGLFRHPDTLKNTWKLTIDREALDPDKARVIEAGNNQLLLLPCKE
ncbi:type VI secretion system lipoprotein TssJ [Pantoea stewartii]|uniref:type VI secretion system lipoprotein TssJ n=1 Tax=Pantoea stewartii TaxID=66269 RepID=UPI0023F67AD5|nr:type VI secretion system lipoprotein TssJ [Pantoea stewartii]MDF7785850.1 type VI secretion system lipoprotein TssJ [Pantoea stewartii]